MSAMPTSTTSTSNGTSQTTKTKSSTVDPQAWRRGFETISREQGFTPLRVEGKLPEDLRGAFYRNGVGKMEVAGERYGHWFDGDGLVMGVRLDGKGGALGGAKLVETPWREREARANKRLFGGYGTPMKTPIREILSGTHKNPANTSVMIHNGRLFALCEAGKPFEISTEDLATIGESDLDGSVLKNHAFSAHPHRVPSHQTTYGFGLTAGKDTKVACYALRDGEKARAISRFAIPGQRMNHDFAATDKHLVFFFAPVFFSLWSMLMRRDLVGSSKYRSEKGTEIVIVPLADPTNVIRFTVPAFYMEHTVNAYERASGEIVIDYVHYENLRGLEDYVSGIANATPKRGLASSLRRAIIDPKKKTFRSEPLLDEHVELPRVSPLVDTTEYRFTYAVKFDQANAPPTSLLKHDQKNPGSGSVEHYAPGTDQFPGEPVFVPRAKGNGGGGEDDGWLLTLVLDAKKGASHLQVLDAARMSEGPVARCHFDHAIPFGFHGIWDPA